MRDDVLAERPRPDLPLWASVLAMVGIVLGGGVGAALDLGDPARVLVALSFVVALPGAGAAVRRRRRGAST